jgi:hypothetical protein
MTSFSTRLHGTSLRARLHPAPNHAALLGVRPAAPTQPHASSSGRRGPARVSRRAESVPGVGRLSAARGGGGGEGRRGRGHDTAAAGGIGLDADRVGAGGELGGDGRELGVGEEAGVQQGLDGRLRPERWW